MSKNHDEQILDKLGEILNRLEAIEHRVDKIEQSASNMDTHISFVEGIYDTCKMPFFTLMNMVTRLSLTQGEQTPQVIPAITEN